MERERAENLDFLLFLRYDRREQCSAGKDQCVPAAIREHAAPQKVNYGSYRRDFHGLL